MRRGFAVILALFSIILFGAIAAAMAFAAKAETSASAGMLGSSRTLSAAEASVWNSIAAHDWTAALSLLPGQFQQVSGVTGPFSSTVYVVRLDSTCFFVQANVVSGPNVAGTARFVRRIGVTIEIVRDTAGAIRALRVPNRAWTELF